MLREFKHVKQEPGLGRRRWWTGDGLELIAWHDGDDRFTGFQLCYAGCAFTWRNTGYWTHVRVNDSGKWRGMSSPVLESNGAPTRPPFTLVEQFDRAAESVNTAIRDAVTSALRAVII
ncbi:MAG: hypothetical protein ACQKBV_00610 [Puniceicoccales bacterium]